MNDISNVVLDIYVGAFVLACAIGALISLLAPRLKPIPWYTFNVVYIWRAHEYHPKYWAFALQVATALSLVLALPIPVVMVLALVKF